MRSRFKDSGLEESHISGTTTWKWPDGNSATSDWEGLATVSRRIAQGTNVPNFHRRTKAGELLPMTYWSEEYFSAEAYGSYYADLSPIGMVSVSNPSWNGTGPYWRSVEDARFPDELLPDATPYIQGAAATLYTKGFDLGTFVAELDDTFRMIYEAFRRIISAKNFKSTLRKRGLLSDLWLEYRYGWRPLVADLQELHERLTSIEDLERTIFTQRYGSRTLHSEKIPYSFQNLDLIGSGTISIDTDISVRGNIASKLKPAHWLTDLPITAWESIPLSFLVDRFITVGNAIAASRFVAENAGYTASAGWQITSELSSSIGFSPGENAAGVGGSSLSLHGTYTRTLRVPRSIPLKPVTHVRLDALLGADILALIRQRTK